MITHIATASIMEVLSNDFQKESSENTFGWNFEKRPGMLYVAARAVSVGTNGNADHFSYDELKKSWDTFVGKGVFVNHQSQDITAKRGKIVDAKFVDKGDNEDTHVVCLMEINADAYPDLAKMIKAGMADSVSMGIIYDLDESPQYVQMADFTQKRYKDMQIGDKVFTHDGSLGEVTGRGFEFCNNAEAYKIKTLNNIEIVLSHDHPLFVLKKDLHKIGNQAPQNSIYKEDFIEAKFLRKGDYLLSPIYSKIVKNEEFTEEAVKLIGWYLAEGSFIGGKGCNGISFSLHREEISFQQEIIRLAQIVDPESTQGVNFLTENCVNVDIYSKKIKNLIKENIFGSAKEKTLSQAIIDMEPEKQLALIGSYIDGDGCMVKSVNKRKPKEYKNLQISTASLKLLQQIPIMLERSGITSSFASIHRKPDANSVVKNNFAEHTIRIGSTYAELFKPYSFKAKQLKSKNRDCKRSFVYGNYIATPIISIEKFKYTGVGLNIQVGSSENIGYNSNPSYLINGMGSHNCRVAYSNCSICMKKSASVKEYCSHLKFNKGGYDGFRKVYEINHDLEFVELSLVSTGADPQAKILQIIAKQARLENRDEREIWSRASHDPSYVDRLAESQQALELTVLASIKLAKQMREV